MGEFSNFNAAAVLAQVNAHIEELEAKNTRGYSCNEADWARYTHKGYSEHKGWSFKMDSVYEALSIFDWWNEELSLSQLKQMKKFLEQAIELGFTGYVCFKVGAKHCAHGMWAYKVESTAGCSPEGDTLYHSFRSGDNYFDMELDGQWMHDKYADPEQPYSCPNFTLKQIKAELAGQEK